MKRRRYKIKMGFGGASVILIITTVGMVVFALLALRSASVEKRLAVKTAEAVKAYFGLDAMGEERISEISGIFNENPKEFKSRAKAVRGVKEVSESGDEYAVELMLSEMENEDIKLNIKVSVNKVSGETDITEWKFVRSGFDGAYEFELPD